MLVKDIDGFGSYGSIIEGIDLEQVTSDEWNEVKHIHANSLVTIIRLDKKLHYEKYYKLINDIGNGERTTERDRKHFRLKKKTVEIFWNITIDPKYPYLRRVSALKDERGLPLGAFGDGELQWHSNDSGKIDFVPGIALMGYQSMGGTATGFLQSADYFESLSDSFQSELKEMNVVHNYVDSKVYATPVPDQEEVYKLGFCPEPNAKIPLVIKSPSGIVGLHLGINTFDYIDGMSKDESDKLRDRLREESFKEEYMLDYWWENDQNIVLFDNSITMHRRTMNKKSCGDRIAYRVPFRYDSIYGEYNYNI